MRVTMILVAALALSACADPPTYLTGKDLSKLNFNLFSVNMGIYPDQSVLLDPNNPFAYDPPSETVKWDLQTNAGPVAGFYSWATLNANVPGGESQYYVAVDLQQSVEIGKIDAANAPTVTLMAIRAYQAVLDYFPASVTYDKTGTIAYDLATPSYKGITALGGMVQGGWALLKTSDGQDRAVKP